MSDQQLCSLISAGSADPCRACSYVALLSMMSSFSRALLTCAEHHIRFAVPARVVSQLASPAEQQHDVRIAIIASGLQWEYRFWLVFRHASGKLISANTNDCLHSLSHELISSFMSVRQTAMRVRSAETITATANTDFVVADWQLRPLADCRHL